MSGLAHLAVADALLYQAVLKFEIASAEAVVLEAANTQQRLTTVPRIGAQHHDRGNMRGP